VSYRPKLIATDLDGTICPHDKPISERTIQTLTKAHESGVKIYFVTGRPPRWMKQIKDAFYFGEAICSNGAMLWDIQGEKVIEEWRITPADLRETVIRLRKALPDVHFAFENHGDFRREKRYIARWDVGVDNEGMDDILDHAENGAVKLLVRGSDKLFDSDELLAAAHRVVGDIVTVTHSNPWESLLEISAHGVTKGDTLATLCERMKIDREDVVAFGDNPNDFSMLEFAGRSYAMSDGHPDAIKYATATAPPCDEDGVAQVVEELLNLPARSEQI
jgi:Cof subfamily protein (haloacid dehalogenase superfamily)